MALPPSRGFVWTCAGSSPNGADLRDTKRSGHRRSLVTRLNVVPRPLLAELIRPIHRLRRTLLCSRNAETQRARMRAQPAPVRGHVRELGKGECGCCGEPPEAFVDLASGP